MIAQDLLDIRVSGYLPWAVIIHAAHGRVLSQVGKPDIRVNGGRGFTHFWSDPTETQPQILLYWAE